jgi:hypothetical protein
VHEGELYLGGEFAYAGGKPSGSLARWREAMTPALLSSFTLAAAPPGVDVTWISEAPSESFQLRAALGEASWIVAHEERGGGCFFARDAHPALANGGHATYRLFQRDGEAGWQLLRREDIDLAPVVAPELRLSASPNPSNPKVGLSFTLARTERLRLEIMDVRGRRLATLAQGNWPAGPYRIEWDGKDGLGRALPSGIYLARLQAGRAMAAEKLVLIR